MKPLAHYVGERSANALRGLGRFPLVYQMYREARMALHALATLGPKLLDPEWLFTRPSAPRQRVLRWGVPASESGSLEQLRQQLRRRNLHFSEGKHTIYLPPQTGLADFLGEMVGHYPPQAGFKVLKQAGDVSEARYLVDKEARWLASRWMGGLLNQMDAANALWVADLAPRVYDLAELQMEGGIRPAFVVEHVEGSQPSAEECRDFLQKLESRLAEWKGAFALVAPEMLDHGDFQPPDCNGNLMRRASDGALLYVDFQQFRVLDRQRMLRSVLKSVEGEFHFGATRLFRGGRPYLYQSVPGIHAGKRDTGLRSRSMASLLRDQGCSFEGRTVLDLGCNSGMMLASALEAGARWGIGWDLPAVARAAERVQCLMGNTRLLFVPGALRRESPLDEQVPVWLQPMLPGSVVLFLAVWRHVGFPAALAKLPWKALVYEGHQEDVAAESDSNISYMENHWNCRRVWAGNVRDGDSAARPLALMVRESQGPVGGGAR
ncbi:MAG: hypothetical protein ACRD24_08055 [Terriglobales bacterium]